MRWTVHLRQAASSRRRRFSAERAASSQRLCVTAIIATSSLDPLKLLPASLLVLDDMTAATLRNSARDIRLVLSLTETDTQQNSAQLIIELCNLDDLRANTRMVVGMLVLLTADLDVSRKL